MDGFFLIPKKGTGGGAEAIPLIVTCSDSFAGSTITASDGTSTLTETCPSSSPYEVTFILPNDGSWTISGTASGQTFTTSILIEPYETTLDAIPEGSTVLPTDDIQTWLYCAGIFDKSYSTVSEVLSDASTLQALIASTNATDYLVRSTTWVSSITSDSSAMGYIGLNNYCSDVLLSDSTWRTAICNSTYLESVLNAKVPTMTSNTAPSGRASCSSTWDDRFFDAYIAFANNGEGWISSANAAFPQYLNYEFPDALKVVKVKFENHNGGNANINGSFQESSDGTTYDDVFTYTTSSGTQAGFVVNSYPSTAKKYYRFKCNSYNYNNNASTIAYAQIYGRIDV